MTQQPRTAREILRAYAGGTFADKYPLTLDDTLRQLCEAIGREVINPEYEAAYNRSDSDPVYVATVKMRHALRQFFGHPTDKQRKGGE